MRVIGFDPGMDRTGFGVLENKNGKLSYIASGTIVNIAQSDYRGKHRAESKIQSKLDSNIHKRLAYLQEQTLQIVLEHQPNFCAVEDVFSGPFVKSSLTLAMARSAILAVLGREDIKLGGGEDMPVLSFSPTEIKKMITGKGSASKDLINIMVQRHLGLTGKISTDSADALALAICCYHSIKSKSQAEPESKTDA